MKNVSTTPTISEQVDVELGFQTTTKIPSTNAENSPLSGLVLRDESDVIMDSLKGKLKDLEHQLDQLYAQDSLHFEQQTNLLSQQQAIVPYLASRLHTPAKMLAHTLDSLLSQSLPDSVLTTLNDCKIQASWLSAALQHIADNHPEMSAVGGEQNPLPYAAFIETLESCCDAVGLSFEKPADELPFESIACPTSLIQSVLAVWTELGQPQTQSLPVEVNFQKKPSDEQIVLIRCGGVFISQPSWHNQTKPKDQANRLTEETLLLKQSFEQGISMAPEIAVSWFYLEKIVAMRGGALNTWHQGEGQYGIEIMMPLQQPAETNP